MTAPTAEDLVKLREHAESELADVTTTADLEAWRVEYLGRKGKVPQLLRQVKTLPSEQRRQIGQAANELRQTLTAWYEQKKPTVGSEITSSKSRTVAPPAAVLPGHLHPLTLTLQRLHQIFAAMGFNIVEGPEIEEAKYNFDQLNIAFEHPARAETDTFYLQGLSDLVMRTHVSPIQIRGVLEHKLAPPFRMMYFGRCFRAEKVDATHETTFHQFEFLMVDEHLTISNLREIIQTVYSTFFGKAVNIRLRPAYFPFVEPGLEVDISCVFCEQKGCRVCKHTGWIEMAGAGAVHPTVLRNINIDPKRYTGLAMGAAVDRLAMLLYNINDIRLFWSGDIRFLKQFS